MTQFQAEMLLLFLRSQLEIELVKLESVRIQDGNVTLNNCLIELSNNVIKEIRRQISILEKQIAEKE